MSPRNVFVAMLAILALLSGCNKGGFDASSVERDSYQKIISIFEPSGPWLTVSGDSTQQRPANYARILIAESLRYQATRDSSAQKRIRHAADFLIGSSDSDGDGVVGWGTGYSMSAYDLDALPSETIYSIDTAVVLESLLESVNSGALEAQDEASILSIVKAAALGWSQHLFVWDSDQTGFYLYSSNTDQDYFTPNVTARLGGVFAKFLALFPETFTAEETALMRRTLNACAQKVVAAWRSDSFSWAYSDFEGEPIDFNDLAHHVTILLGLEQFRKYLGLSVPYSKPDAVHSIEAFFDDGAAYEYPIELRGKSPDVDPFNRPARLGAISQTAGFLAMMGEGEWGSDVIDSVVGDGCGEMSQDVCLVGLHGLAALLFGASL